MKRKTNPKLKLSPAERKKLRSQKTKISELIAWAPDEIEAILEVDPSRARTIKALAEFQSLPSVGIKFAEDLIFLGFYKIDELKDQDGARLVEDYERKKGYWIDPCVEDQFRLVVHLAKNPQASKNWWDFTEERKKYRAEHGYPADRPSQAWHEVLEKQKAPLETKEYF